MCDGDATAVDDPLASTALCQVCFEPYSEQERLPKLLPCGHTFCERCIVSLTATCIYTCRCPKCRGAFVLRYDTTFPTNYSLLDVLSHVRQSMPAAEQGARCEQLSQDHISTSSTPGGSRHRPGRVSAFIARLSGKNKKDIASDWSKCETEAPPFTSTPDESEGEHEFEQVATESESDSDWDGDMQLAPSSDLDHAPLRRHRPSLLRAIPRTEHLNPLSTSAVPPSDLSDTAPLNGTLPTPIPTEGETSRLDTEPSVVQVQSADVVQSSASSETCPLYTYMCSLKDSTWHYAVVVFEWTVVLVMAVLLLLLGRLAYSEHSRAVEEPGVLCTTLDVVDSWTETHLARAANCELSTKTTLYERLNTEAERLGTDLYDAVWQAGCATSELLLNKGTELHEQVVAISETAFSAGQDTSGWFAALSQWISHTKHQLLSPHNEPSDEL